MKKLLRIDKKENLCIYLLGHKLMFVNHYIMKFDKLDSYKFCDDFTVKRITEENVSECEDGEYSLERINGYIKDQNDKCEGFLFYADGKKIGYIWIMYKGGTELQYKIRNIDAFLFYFCVFDDERGKGYSEKIMSHILLYLKNEKNIDSAYLGVRKNNKIAIHVYEKLGAKIICSKKFFRIKEKNIPYHKL